MSISGGYDGSLKFDTKIDNSGFSRGVKELKEQAKKGGEAAEKAVKSTTNMVEKTAEAVSKNSTNVKKCTESVKTLTNAVSKSAEEITKTTEATSKTKFDIKGAEQASEKIKDVAKKTKEVGEESEKTKKKTDELGEAFKKASKKIDDFSVKGIKALSKVVSKGAKVAAAAIGASVTALSGLAGIGIKYNQEMETYSVAMTTLLGNAEKAAAAMSKIKDDAARTPFDVASLTKANQLLISAGVDAEKSRDDIMNLANAVAATGGGSDELSRMAQNLQQIKNLGKASAVDIKQFANAGINIYGILADYMGVTTEEAAKLNVSYDDLTAALKYAASASGKYSGALETQSKTFKGQISTLKDNSKALLGDVTASLTTNLKNKALPLINGYMDRLKQAFSKGSYEGLVKEFGNVLGDAVGKIAEQAPQIVKQGANLVKSFIKGVLDNKEILIKSAGEIVKVLVDALISILPHELQAPIKSALAEISKAFKSIDLKKILKDIGTLSKDIMKVIIGIAKTAIPPLVKAVGFLAKNLKTIAPLVLSIAGGIKAYNIITQVATKVTKAYTVAQNALSKAWAAHPVALVTGGVAALCVGLTELYAATNDEIRSARESAAAAKESLEVTQERSAAYKDLISAQKEQATADVAQFDNVNNLWLELKKLAGATGEVEDADRTRAEFIIGQLNEALGTEYTMTGNVIDNYAKMRGEIENLIKIKRFEALQSSAQALYEDAVANSKDKATKATEAYNNMINAKTALEAKEAKMQEILATGNRELYDSMMQGNDYAQLKKAYQDYSEDYQIAYSDMQTSLAIWHNFEEGTMLAAEGDYEGASAKMQSFMTDTGLQLMGFKENTAENLEAVETGFNTAKQTLATYIADVEAGRTEFNESFFRELINDAAAYYEQGQEMGANVGDGMIEGFAGTETSLANGAETACESLVSAAKSYLGIASPSKVFKEIGGFTGEGLRLGLAEKTAPIRQEGANIVKQLMAAFATLRHQMYNISTNAINGLIEGLTNGAPRVLAKARSLAEDVARTMKKALDIHSPSRVMRDEVGRNITLGVAEGVDAERKTLLSRIKALGSDAVNAMGAKMSGAVNRSLATAAYGAMSNSYNYTTNNQTQNFNFYTNHATPYQIALAARQALEVR